MPLDLIRVDGLEHAAKLDATLVRVGAGQQRLQRRVLAVLHHELLNGALYLRIAGAHGAVGSSIRMNTGHPGLPQV